ncbi:hypothetical protein LZT27_16665 [Aeromonas veronii]|nr:hypothetical protein [Aeromonas veronii]MDD1846223.1 hypothetical protein [Aeromonas veronii]
MKRDRGNNLDTMSCPKRSDNSRAPNVVSGQGFGIVGIDSVIRSNNEWRNKGASQTILRTPETHLMAVVINEVMQSLPWLPLAETAPESGLIVIVGRKERRIKMIDQQIGYQISPHTKTSEFVQ